MTLMTRRCARSIACNEEALRRALGVLINLRESPGAGPKLCRFTYEKAATERLNRNAQVKELYRNKGCVICVGNTLGVPCNRFSGVTARTGLRSRSMGAINCPFLSSLRQKALLRTLSRSQAVDAQCSRVTRVALIVQKC
jgi:hypothetical protein